MYNTWKNKMAKPRRDVNERRLKAEGLAGALPKASQCWVSGTQTTCHISHQWKAHPSQSPLIWLRRLSCRWRQAKAPGPSGIVVEMTRAAGDMGASMISDLAVAIIRDGKVPSDWEQSFIVCLYKGKGDALERGNYYGLKLTEQVMKILERIVDSLIRQLVSIDDSQFGFVPGRGNYRRNLCCQAAAREVSSCQ